MLFCCLATNAEIESPAVISRGGGEINGPLAPSERIKKLIDRFVELAARRVIMVTAVGND